jgi:hypothetical protein
MKKNIFIPGLIIILFLTTTGESEGQTEMKKYDFNPGLDLYSTYVWRGTSYGRGPHFQPELEFTTGGMAIGIWGSVDFNGYSEADPYISYSFPFGLSLGLTDYYYPGLPFFNTSSINGSHAFEINCNYTAGGLGLSANYILNEAGGAGSAGGDIYFQIAYEFSRFNLFAGAGNGWLTTDGSFNLCNLGLGTEEIIEVTEKFSFQLNGQIIFNPDSENLYLTVGISF